MSKEYFNISLNPVERHKTSSYYQNTYALILWMLIKQQFHCKFFSGAPFTFLQVYEITLYFMGYLTNNMNCNITVKKIIETIKTSDIPMYTTSLILSVTNSDVYESFNFSITMNSDTIIQISRNSHVGCLMCSSIPNQHIILSLVVNLC